MTAFRIAPMAPFIRWLTWGLCALPVAFVVAGVSGQSLAPMLGVGLFLCLLYAAVWVWWRPSRFELSEDGLALVFPGRRRLVPASQIAAVQAVTSAQLRERFGVLLRVGAGGLWGGFGWLWSRRGWLEFYVSTLSGYVLVERRGRMPLLISPEHPARFVAALRAVAASAPVDPAQPGSTRK
jgi:hypothetical protein